MDLSLKPGKMTTTEMVNRDSFWREKQIKNKINKVMQEYKIRKETNQDYEAVREINFKAFNRYKEPDIVDEARKSGNIVISLLAELDGKPVGYIMLSRGYVEKENGERVGILLIGPVAVIPEFQKQGAGSALMWEGIKLAKEKGESAIILLGHKEYYPKFGFDTSLVSGIDSPFNKESFMGLELIEGSLKGLEGKIKYAKAFGLDPEWTV